MTLLLLTTLAVGHSPDPEVWNAIEHFRKGVELRGNAALARPEFAKAAAAFDELPLDSPAVNVCRARAHRLAGNLPRAILVLRQGLARTPYDRDLQEALESARAEVAYAVGSELEAQARMRPRASIRTILSPTQVTILGGAIWLMACLAATRYFMKREGQWLGIAVVAIGAVAAILVMWWQGGRALVRANAAPLAVVAEDVILRSGNAASYAPRLEAPLPRGVELRVLGERGGWLHVELAGGACGWVPVDTVGFPMTRWLH